jgi:DNA-binding SARP family transcriptional activator/tetratricopeptide (TPR) repeat protein
MPVLCLHFLGPLDIRCDDQQLPKPPTAKSQSLLAYLVLHRHQVQPRERLAGLFWGDRSDRKARRSLTTALWHIRRCLPQEGLLLSDAHSAQFDPQADLWLDVDKFESLASHHDVSSLQAAVALYRGDLLSGFYDDWILNERYRLETLFGEALARLMVSHEMRGEHDAALTTALRLLRGDLLREDAHRAVMRAYCRLGQRHAAVRQYRHCQEVLHQELGVEPTVETAELYRTILEGRFEIGPAPEGIAVETVTVEPAPAPGRSPLDAIVPGPLVGREEELAFLGRCWQGAEAGHGGLVLVSGEAGVGKTRLMEGLAEHLRWQGARVLWGRSYEFERALPYQPVAEALRMAVSTVSQAELAGCPPWVLGEVARLVPELQELHGELELVTTVRPEQEQVRLFDGILRFLGQVSSHGALLVVVEDLHWASESTLALLHFLARHLVEFPALVMGTLRPEELAGVHPLRDLQRRLEREGLAQLLPLTRLSEAAVEILVREMSGEDQAVVPLAQRLFHETEGNPFFLMEILKALFAEDVIRLAGDRWIVDFSRISQGKFPLPVSVGEAIQARIRRLNRETQKAVRLSAVLGREFDFDLLNAAWGQGEEATLTALDDLLRRRLIAEGVEAAGRDYAFSHHKVQEVVYAGLPRRRRQFLHGQVAAAMEQLSGGEIPEMAGELAYHFEQALQLDPTQADKAIAYLQQAGDQARRAHAHQEAMSFYRRALALVEAVPPERRGVGWQLEMAAQLHEGLGDLLGLTGRHEKARAAFGEALTSVPKHDRIWQSRLCRKTGKTWEVQHEYGEAAQAYNLSESMLGPQQAGSDLGWWQAWIEVQVDKTWLLYWQHQYDRMAKLTESARPAVEEYGTPAQRARFFQVLVASAWERERHRPSVGTLGSAQALLAASQETHDAGIIGFSQFILGFACLWRDELEEAEDALQTALLLAQRTADAVLESRCLTYLTVLSRRRGQVEEARHYISRSLPIAATAQVPVYVGMVQANLAWIAWREGDHSVVEVKGQAALDIWAEEKNFPFQWAALWPLAGVALARQDVARAMAQARRMLHPPQQLLPAEMATAMEAAIQAWDQGRADVAQDHLQRAAETAADLGYL